jgi:hypothetical protein
VLDEPEEPLDSRDAARVAGLFYRSGLMATRSKIVRCAMQPKKVALPPKMPAIPRGGKSASFDFATADNLALIYVTLRATNIQPPSDHPAREI